MKNVVFETPSYKVVRINVTNFHVYKQLSDEFGNIYWEYCCGIQDNAGRFLEELCIQNKKKGGKE